MKVDERSDRHVQDLHVTEELRLAEWMQSFDSLKLQEQATVYQDVKTLWFIEDNALVLDSN